MFDLSILLPCLLTSAVVAAVVTAMKDIKMLKLNRKYTKEDAEDSQQLRIDNIDIDIENVKKDIGIINQEISEIATLLKEHVRSNEDLRESIIEGNRLVFQDRIKFLALGYIKQKEISFEDRKSLHTMWEFYHTAWGGNGDLNPVMEAINNLPLVECNNKESSDE